MVGRAEQVTLIQGALDQSLKLLNEAGPNWNHTAIGARRGRLIIAFAKWDTLGAQERAGLVAEALWVLKAAEQRRRDMA
jgi:hypothetical protein